MTWAEWQSHLDGDQDEDLARVFTRVRLQDAPPVRAVWARDPATRTFCDLSLHLLYQNTIEYTGNNPISCEVNLAPVARGEDLERHAMEMIHDPDRVAALTATRWRQTWQTPDDFLHDVFAYLFRLGPYVRRIRAVHLILLELMKAELTLGPFIRQAVDLEIKSNLADPLAALQTAVLATFPAHPEIRRYVRRLDGGPLQLWARLYAVVFDAYELERRPDKSWFDVADIYTTVADGQLLRARSHKSPERLTNGDVVLSAVILGMMTDLFKIERLDVETLPVVKVPDHSIDWRKRHNWEDEEER